MTKASKPHSASGKHSRSYSDAVKRAAIHSVVVKGQTCSSVAACLHCARETVSCWVRQHQHNLKLPQSNPSSPPEFVPVQIVADPPPSNFLELCTPSGFVLRLPATLPVPQLAELLHSLR